MLSRNSDMARHFIILVSFLDSDVNIGHETDSATDAKPNIYFNDTLLFPKCMLGIKIHTRIGS